MGSEEKGVMGSGWVKWARGWLESRLEVGAKKRNLGILEMAGLEPFLRAWMGAKVARGGSSGWLGLESGVRGVGPWGWVRCRLARGGLKGAMKW